LNDTDLIHMQVDLTEEGKQLRVLLAGGDIRLALNALELAAQTCQPDAQQRRRIQPDQIQEAVQKRILRHDKRGDSHYDLISALIKSVRGSNPDAAIYWLVRLLEGGEDARFIARRLVILASEDIGLADPQALLIADAAARAVEYVGLPEAQLNLAHATIYLACAAKSNSAYQALLAAQAEVKQKPAYPVPLHLRNAPTQLMKEMGHGQGYQYDHQTPDHVADQEHLPEELQGVIYYHPTNIGYEQQIRTYMETVKKIKSI
jgi:putative ATPase